MTPLMKWLDDRTGFRSVMHEALYERVPGGARWRYVWGSTLVFVFMLQVLTGFMLWMFYSPNTRGAWESVHYIQHEVFLGSVVRGLHHYAAQAMVVLIGIHLIQVVIDGAYRAPREINFWLGIILLNIVLGLSLTGYLLPWDQKGYYATRVTTNIVSSAPVIGPAAQILAQGGPQYGHLTLTRFFAMHAGILPTLLVAFLALHIYCFRRQGLTVADKNHAPETTFWPDQVLKDAVACLGVLTVLLLFAVFRGAELGAPADPVVKFDAARPEWYYLFLFRFLRFHAVEALGVTFGAIIVPGIIMGILAAMPLTAKFLGESGHRLNKAFTWGMTAVIVGLTALAVFEDQADVSHQSALAEAEREAHRAHELATGPEGRSRISSDGAMEMMRNDPFTQGPRLFAKHCASCHRWNGHNGRGVMVLDRREQKTPDGDSYDPQRFESYTAVPTAADLGNFGTRDWMRSVILNYSEHFAWLKNAQWYRDGDEDGLDPENSEMADWSGDSAALTAQENAADVDALIEFLVAETGREDMNVDPEKVARGSAVAIDGDWSLESCATCHGTIGQEFAASDTDDTYGYPTLAKYGSVAWLKDFIRYPDAERHYGIKNRMPAYSVEKLGEMELDLLVRWMTHDYPETRVEDYPAALVRLRQDLEGETPGSAAVPGE